MKISNIPIWMRILSIIVFLFFVRSIAGKIHQFVTLAAIFTWVIVVCGVFYSSGFLSGIANLRVIGRLVMWVSLPSNKTSTNIISEAECRLKELQSITGGEQVIENIQKRIEEITGSPSLHKQYIINTKAWITVIHGPLGVGKSTIANALADLLIGHKIVDIPKKIELTRCTSAENAETYIDQKLRESLGAVFFVDGDNDGAGWLVGSDDSSGPTYIRALLAAIEACAKSDPGKLAIIFSISTEQYNKIFSDEHKQSFLRKVALEADYDCSPIKREKLYDFFISYIRKNDRELDQNLEKRMKSIIGEHMKSDKFGYLAAMKSWADDLTPILGSRKLVTANDLDALEFKLVRV